MAINAINNNEAGASVRAKLNLAITEANKVDNKMSSKKYQIHASSLLPLTANKVYYIESDVFPAQVFSETATQGVKLFIPDSAIPVGATPQFKIRFQAYHAETSEPTDLNVAWEAAATWVLDGAEGVTLGTAQYVVHTLETTDGKLRWSEQSALVTPTGLREAGADVRIQIRRNTAYEVGELVQDNLDAPAYLYKIEIEWEV